MDNNHYNKNLKGFARTLRTDSTKAEIRLWCKLLSNKKLGYQFLRQRPVHNFIADFMSKELRLIIEVDGYSHNFKADEDEARDIILADMGYTTLRFSHEEVMKDLINVQRTLENWIASWEENRLNDQIS